MKTAEQNSDQHQDDESQTDEQQEQSQVEDEQQQSEGEGEQQQQEGEGDAEEVVVTIGEESPPPEDEEHAKAPEWVKELRKNHRDLVRENRELKAKLDGKPTENKPVELGPKPTLEDHDYDTEKFEQELAKWYDRKREVDEAAAKADAQQKEAQSAWQAKLDAYGKAKAELKVKDMEDAEAQATEVLNVTQQGIILQGAENPALVVYALGKNPKKAKELSSITDPVKFAFAVAKLETQLKVTNRKAAPPPEKTVASGSAPKSGAVDSTLEKLRAEAEKTGDFSKVIAHRRKQQKAA